ncbi:putative DNA (cytosine-5)-methyltransferase 1, replication foci domain-containing protein [Helianthus annuus]|nr:putative DNA (cytosine-5)-methyltransferase 1, replication foci domain-containing protein [Helianthus annuus]
MASSDDEGETFPDAVSEYDFRNKDDEPLSFSKLPVQWNDNESSSVNVMPIFLKGKVDNGLGPFYRQVKAWKYDITATKPQISVLTKDNHWIKLKKPRKSYEELIRSILISVHCLWFCKSKPEASGKSLRDYLSKVFRYYYYLKMKGPWGFSPTFSTPRLLTNDKFNLHFRTFSFFTSHPQLLT